MLVPKTYSVSPDFVEVLEIKSGLLTHIRQLSVNSRDIPDQLGALKLQASIGGVNKEPSHEGLGSDCVLLQFEESPSQLSRKHIRLEPHHQPSNVSIPPGLLEFEETLLNQGCCLPSQL